MEEKQSTETAGRTAARPLKAVYPQGKQKALAFSYDDGQVSDRKLVGIFNRYRLKATFHLNSGTLAAKRTDETFVAADEIAELYAGHEIAAHGVHHRNLSFLTPCQISDEILEDRRRLEALTGSLIPGMSYAYGKYSETVIQTVGVLGIQYARTVNTTNEFFPPADFLTWHPTCHHNGNLAELGARFLAVPDYVELPLMLVWGHSFEFARNGDWNVIEEFAGRMADKPDIWYATCGEICGYLRAVRSLEFSADGQTVRNPTATAVWFEKPGNGELFALKPGEIFSRCNLLQQNTEPRQ